MTPLTYIVPRGEVFKVKARLNPEKYSEYGNGWLHTQELFVGDCVCLPKNLDRVLPRLTSLTVIDIVERDKGHKFEITFVKLPTFKLSIENHLKICETLEPEWPTAKMYNTEVEIESVRESKATGAGFCACCGTHLDSGTPTLRLDLNGRQGGIYQSPWSSYASQKTSVTIHRHFKDCRPGFILTRKLIGAIH